MKVLASYSMKGGVGKTAAAVNLGYEAANSGARTLIWDLDPQGAASHYLRVRPRVKGGGQGILRSKTPISNLVKGTDFPNLDLLPADFSYRNLDLDLDGAPGRRRRLRRILAPVADDYDYVLLDCPPGLSLVAEAVFLAADALLVPVVPTTLSVRALETLTGFLDQSGCQVKVLCFVALLDRRKRLHAETIAQLSGAQLSGSRYGLLATQIPSASDVELMGARRAPVAAYAPASASALAYRALWNEVKAKV